MHRCRSVPPPTSLLALKHTRKTNETAKYLPQALLNTINTLKEQGLIVEELLTDTGYSSGEALKQLEENQVTCYIPNFGQYKATRERLPIMQKVTIINVQEAQNFLLNGSKILIRACTR